MKYTVTFATFIASAQAAILISLGGKHIPDSYIVVLKDGTTADSFKTKFDDIFSSQNGSDSKFAINHKYDSIGGFAATISQGALKAVLASKDVSYVERDMVFSIQGSQPLPPWGISRVSQRDRDTTRPYVYNDAAGEGVTAYVIDSGIYAEHKQFEGRATRGMNFIDKIDTDENGHGTHVAGTIGGFTYGVAKKVKLVGVKVLGADGDGSTSSVLAGMDWVAKNAIPGKSVVNMSLGSEERSKAVDDAAQRLFRANIPLIVAAGNNATFNSCNGSPSGSDNTFTVAASNENDQVADFSSF
ncbi:subtilisin-like serine protease, partial [Modicella reniformis]